MSAKARLALELTLAGASGVLGGLRTISGGIGTFMGGVGSANQQLFYLLQNMRAFAAAGAQFASALIDPNIQTEKWTQRLSYLLKSGEAAKNKLKELFDIATENSMDVGDVVDLYYNLAKVGDGAIASTADLELWIRAAKRSSQQASVMGVEMSKIWSALESGESPERELKKMREEGLISKDAFAGILEMAEGGSSPSKVFEAIRLEIARNTKDVGTFGDTFEDVKVRLVNYFTEIKGQAGAGLFESFKDDLEELDRVVAEFFESGRAEKWASGISDGLKKAFAKLKETSFGGVTLDDVVSSLDNGTTLSLIKEMFGVAAANFWSVMVYSAQRYGPEITKALVPQKLHSILGLERQSDMARMASGDVRDSDVEKYSKEMRLKDEGMVTKIARVISGGPAAVGANVGFSMGNDGFATEEYLNQQKQALREYALSQGGPKLDFATVDPGRLLALRDPELMRQFADMQMQMISGSSGVLNFRGANITDRSGQSVFVEQSHIESYLRDAAKALSENARTVEMVTQELLRKLESSRPATF